MTSSALALRSRRGLSCDEHGAGVAGEPLAAADERDDVVDVGIRLRTMSLTALLPLLAWRGTRCPAAPRRSR